MATLRVALLWVLSQVPDAGSSPSAGFYIDVPFVHQAPAYCGPAVLTMVFRHWGLTIDQYALAAPFQPVPKQGLRGGQLKEIAAAHEFFV